jgi:hypothetical protein
MKQVSSQALKVAGDSWVLRSSVSSGPPWLLWGPSSTACGTTPQGEGGGSSGGSSGGVGGWLMTSALC